MDTNGLNHEKHEKHEREQGGIEPRMDTNGHEKNSEPLMDTNVNFQFFYP